MTRVFRIRIAGRACENFGAVDYTITDTISSVNGGGIVVATRTLGMCEGERVDQQVERHYPGVSLATAAAYRLCAGYQEITPAPTTSPTGECDPLGCNHPCARCAQRVAAGGAS